MNPDEKDPTGAKSAPESLETSPESVNFAPETLVELRRLARSRPRSGRGQLAKVSALRTLERLNRGRRVVPPMPDGWHPGPPEFEELDRAYLGEHPEVREQWWRALWE